MARIFTSAFACAAALFSLGVRAEDMRTEMRERVAAELDSWTGMVEKAFGENGRGTAGVTPGEPGQGDHGQGMKGLGGASIEVLCHPDMVAPNQDFTVNVKYRTDIKRPVDVKVDVLNAHTKTWYAGTTIPMETQTGEVSATIKMAAVSEEPFLWKVFLAPRGEPFPNMLAETGFIAHLGDKTVQTCQHFDKRGADIPNAPEVDYVMLQGVPAEVTPGATLPVKLNYDLVSQNEATINVSLMKKGPNSLIVSEGAEAVAGKHSTTITLKVPNNVNVEPVYVVATLTPPGASWENRLAEDRTYRINLLNGRLRG